METPTFSQLFCPVADVIRVNGGSATNEQILEALLNRGFQKGAMRKDTKRTELEYRTAWAKSYLKAYGALANPSRGVWQATSKLTDVSEGNIKNIVNYVVREAKKNRKAKPPKKAEKQKAGAVSSNIKRVSSGVSLIDQAKTIISLLENGILTKSAANAALIKLTEVHRG